MIKNVLFDLDGTLLSMDLEAFTQVYFTSLTQKMSQLGFDAKLIMKGLAAGSMAMVKNDGSKTNEQVYWEVFCATTQFTKEQMEPVFYDFYTHEFNDIGKDTPHNEKMVEAVQILKQKGYRLFLATNPLFPSIATQERIEWAGLNPDDFECITTYENSTYCKPNPAYFCEIFEKYDLKQEECMMVGNDTEEDGVIETLGIPLYLIEDCLVNRSNDVIKTYWHGSSENFYALVKTFEQVK